MAEEPIVVGIDIGTTKVCTLVARVEGENSLRILGVGIEPSLGLRKGTIVDIQAASQAIGRSIEKAERSSGLEVTAALISLAGSHVSSVNSKGVVGISGRVIEADDVARALDAARRRGRRDGDHAAASDAQRRVGVRGVGASDPCR